MKTQQEKWLINYITRVGQKQKAHPQDSSSFSYNTFFHVFIESLFLYMRVHTVEK